MSFFFKPLKNHLNNSLKITEMFSKILLNYFIIKLTNYIYKISL